MVQRVVQLDIHLVFGLYGATGIVGGKLPPGSGVFFNCSSGLVVRLGQRQLISSQTGIRGYGVVVQAVSPAPRLGRGASRACRGTEMVVMLHLMEYTWIITNLNPKKTSYNGVLHCIAHGQTS